VYDEYSLYTLRDNYKSTVYNAERASPDNLNKISGWCNFRGFELSLDKTVVVISFFRESHLCRVAGNTV